MKIWISVGESRMEKNWKNVELDWEKFVARLNKPTVTGETYQQYIKYPKDKQDQIKDVGGFVGGIIKGGRRIKGSVGIRHLITLDVDYAPQDFFEDITLLYDYEMLIYATHKHSPTSPRYRLILPLSRPVMADEYEAVSRRIAGDMGIELFDPTTFQVERLMYWPSVSSDQEYYVRRQRGRWIDPDEVLKRYTDWHDVSQWPISTKATKKITDVLDKQEDPAEKGGMVGVFCRIYGIREAIEKFLPDVYEETGYDDRWTYKEGSTAAGLIVYDNKWAFSHHSTDPVSGRLCNSFDLVRIHLFGESDDRVDEKTPSNKKPSFGKMIEKMMEDGEVKQHVVVQRQDEKIKLMEKVGTVEKSQEESEGVVAGAKVDWMKALDMDKKGNILNTISNVVLILENDEKLKGRLCYDDLRKVPMLRGDLPWRKIDKYTRDLKDADDAEYRNYLEIMYGVTNRDKIKDAIEIVIHKNVFHPVRDYLKSIEWDKKERAEELLIRYLGAEDSVYVREVTRKTLVAAVARVFQPGIKFDHVLVIVGPQGLGKSRLVKKLGGEWYSDTFGNLQNKDAMEQIQGVWIMEIGELAGLKRHEVETIKLFISKQEDRFRVAYARRVETFARQCIFIGTTNNDEFLQDATGNRRFWPVKCGIGTTEILTQETVNQIWAEACYWYVNGEDLYLTSEIEGMAKEIQEQYTEQDDRKKMIVDYLEKPVPADWYDLSHYDRISYINGDDTIGNQEADKFVRDWITIPEIWTELFRGSIKDMKSYETKSVRAVMNKIPGWEPKMLNKKSVGHQRGWIRTTGVAIVAT